MYLIIQSVITGMFATFLMDCIADLNEKKFKIKPLNYALVGRWILSWPDGVFLHDNIITSPKKKFEKCVGWYSHYLTGIIWAYCYLNLLSHYLIQKK